MSRRTLPLVLALLAVVVGLVSCANPTQPPPPQAGNPSAACPGGWMRISQQAWLQVGDGSGRVVFPQTLPSGGGGHLHEEFCAPVGQPLAPHQQTFHVELMSHQGFSGHGHKVDVGLAPSGTSLGSTTAPDLHCGPKPAKCHEHAMVSFNYPGGSHNLRVRYLPADLPGSPFCPRWFVGGELPVGNGSGDGFGGKSWCNGYANARFSNLSLFGHALSGTVSVPAYAKGDNVTHTLVHVDARFGADSEGWTVADRAGQFRGSVPLDTTRLTNGWHCLAIRADARVGGNAVQTGVIEAPILVQNPGRPTANGTGACFPGVS